MNAAPISNKVRQFIHDNIHSVEQLEILLLLRGAAERQWSVPEISKALHTTEISVTSRLTLLRDLHLVQTQGVGSQCMYQYSCVDPQKDPIITALERAYRERKDTVIALIFQPRPGKPADITHTFPQRERSPSQG